MSVVWIALGVGLAVAIVIFAASWLRRDQDADIGTVSHQWLAEQRLGQGHDPHR